MAGSLAGTWSDRGMHGTLQDGFSAGLPSSSVEDSDSPRLERNDLTEDISSGWVKVLVESLSKPKESKRLNGAPEARSRLISTRFSSVTGASRMFRSISPIAP